MEMRRATLRAFDAVAYRASVQIVGSRSAFLDAVPVSRAIPAAEMVAGRDCVLVLFEPTDPTDCMVLGIH
jgi:hypothetical protein